MANVAVEKLRVQDVFKHSGEIWQVVAKPNQYKRGNADRVEVPARRVGGEKQRSPVQYLDFRKGARVLRMDL